MPKTLGHSYLEQNNTGAQESGEDICMTLTGQTFARHTPSAKEQAKEHSLALLTHLTYYLCGRPKMNNYYYFLIIVIYISKLFYKILWAKFEARTDDSTI